VIFAVFDPWLLTHWINGRIYHLLFYIIELFAQLLGLLITYFLLIVQLSSSLLPMTDSSAANATVID